MENPGFNNMDNNNMQNWSANENNAFNNKSNKNYVSGGNELFTTSSNHDNSNNKDLNDNKNIVHIVFITLKGNNHARKYNQNDRIKDVLESFVKEFGLPISTLKEIHFLYNATSLNTNLEKNPTLKELGIKNMAKINIIDMKNIIGA